MPLPLLSSTVLPPTSSLTLVPTPRRGPRRPLPSSNCGSKGSECSRLVGCRGKPGVTTCARDGTAFFHVYCTLTFPFSTLLGPHGSAAPAANGLCEPALQAQARSSVANLMTRCEGPLLFLGPRGPAAPAAQGLCEAALQSQAHSPVA